MAEVFGVVSGAVGAAGVAFQFAEGIRKLYQFCKDIRDAPEEIRDSLNQLQLLSYILDAIAADLQKHPIHLATHAGLPAVLEACRQGDAQMTTLLKELKSGMDQRKKLASFKAVWKKDEMKKFVDRIERAKTSLLLAQTVYSSGQMNMGFSSSNARMDQLELAVVSSTTTITQSMITALAQSTEISANAGAAGLNNRNRNMTIPSSSRWQTKRPSDRIAYLRLPFLLQRSWELALYRASGGWHVSLTASRIVASDSPFFKACGDGDIVKIRAMLATGEASVGDVDVFGRNGLYMALYARVHVGLEDTGLDVCQLLLRAGVDMFAVPMCHIKFLELSACCGPKCLRFLISHEDIGPDNFELEGRNLVQRCVDPEAIGVWQDQMWPPWRERSLKERIRDILACDAEFNSAELFKLWIWDSPEDIWTECAELYDDLLAYMLQKVVGAIFFILARYPHDWDEPFLRLEKELASWSVLIRYGLQDKILDSGLWMTNSNTPVQALFATWSIGYSTGPRNAEEMLFYFTNFLYTLGIDLVALGRVEQDKLRLGVTEKVILYAWEKESPSRAFMIGFDYGPKPEDWKIWWSNPLDEWAGEFWESIEDADEADDVSQAEKDMPGAWPDSEDDSSDSD